MDRNTTIAKRTLAKRTATADDASTDRVALVQACWHRDIVDRCTESFVAEMARRGHPAGAIEIFAVPGSFEIPLVARKLAESGQYAAVVCLGCVIRGETGHYDHVAGQAAAGAVSAASP